MPNTSKVTITVGGVRRAAAIVDTTSIKLKTNSDGAQRGNAQCQIDDPVNVSVSMSGEAGDSFTVDVSIEKLGDAKTRKGKLSDDFGFRFYAIPKKEFQDGSK